MLDISVCVHFRINLTWKRETRCLVFGLLPSSAVALSDHTPMDINTKTLGKCFCSISNTFCFVKFSFSATIVHTAQIYFVTVFLNLVAENVDKFHY